MSELWKNAIGAAPPLSLADLQRAYRDTCMCVLCGLYVEAGDGLIYDIWRVRHRTCPI